MAVLELPVLKKINQFFLSEKGTIQKLKCENGKLKEEILSLRKTKENISLNILDKDVSGEVKEESTMYAKIIKEVQGGFDNEDSSEEEQSDDEETQAGEAEAQAGEEEAQAGEAEAQAGEAEAQAGEEEEEEADEEEAQAGEEEQADDVETEAEEEEDSDGEEVFKIEIDDIDYYTNDEVNGFIYEITSNEDVGKKVGYFKDEEPFFY
jgi:cobalamin biosynthesis protein CobT